MPRQWLVCFISVSFLFVLPIGLAQDTIVLNTAGEPPLNTPEQTGFLDLVALEAFKRIGKNLKIVHLPAERGLKNANLGIEDGEMSRIAGLQKSYINLIQVPEKIMDWEFVAYSAKPIDLSKGWANLGGYAVSFVNGWKIIERNVPSSAYVTRVQDHQQLFMLLQKHRTDVAIYERWSGLQMLRTLNITEVSMLKPPLAVREMFIYLHKKHALLVPKLSAALKKMKDDGDYKLIANKVLLPLEKP